jgi:hypothetical protein
MMQVFDRSNISEFLGDQIVYRSLIPQDERLPPLSEIRERIGLSPGEIPRKSEKVYATAVVEMLKQTRQIDLPGVKIARLIFIGDTRLNDGTAFTNICHAGKWPGLAFIGSETSDPIDLEIVQVASNQSLFLANRWNALAEFGRYCKDEGMPIDEETAVIFDLDKTALGARGRNAHVIDQARVQAVEDTVATMLGDGFDKSTFQTQYSTLNKVEFHPFTTDNQDYLAYICLILGSGLFDLKSIVEDVYNGSLRTFEQLINEVESRADKLMPDLVSIHREIYENVQAGDPTPFKAFRRNEYLRTISKMGQMEEGLPVSSYLEQEIVITQEVQSIARAWKMKGALCFGLSDKPDEASIPTGELKEQGYLPIHKTETHVIGMI